MIFRVCKVNKRGIIPSWRWRWELSCNGGPPAKYGGQLRWKGGANFSFAQRSAVNEHENMLVSKEAKLCVIVLRYLNVTTSHSQDWSQAEYVVIFNTRKEYIVAFVLGVYCLMWVTVCHVLVFYLEVSYFILLLPDHVPYVHHLCLLVCAATDWFHLPEC